MKEYKNVPSIITGKDLDYLNDMFNWLYGAYKNTLEARNMIEDTSLKKHLESCLNVFYDAMDEILLILEGGCNEDCK